MPGRNAPTVGEAVAWQAGRIECRVGVSPPQRSERDDWLVTDARLQQPVEFGEAGPDVFGHGCRLGLAVLDIKPFPFPFIGGSLPFSVAVSLVRLADGPGLGPLEFAKLPLADPLLPRAFPLYLCPQPVPVRHARSLPRPCPHLVREPLMRTVTTKHRIVKPYPDENYGPGPPGDIRAPAVCMRDLCVRLSVCAGQAMIQTQ